MASRLELDSKLRELLGNIHVYYQTPESLKLTEYPYIKYSKIDIESKYANNKKYSNINRYQIIVVDTLPDNKVIHKILDLPMSSYDRHYKSDNLNHDVINLYF